MEHLLFPTYLAAIKNSLGSKLFKSNFFKINNKKKDLLRNGELSCGFYVSSILYLFKLIKDIHVTVDGTIKDLEKSGWRKITKPKPGAVIVWEGLTENNETHKHIGFYINNNMAVSNSSKNKIIAKHHWTYGNKNGKPIRKVTNIYWNQKLET